MPTRGDQQTDLKTRLGAIVIGSIERGQSVSSGQTEMNKRRFDVTLLTAQPSRSNKAIDST